MAEIVKIDGYSTLKAWPEGLIAQLLSQGLTLPQAIQQADKKCVYRNTQHNLFVSAGKYLVIDFLIGESRTGLSYHALGTYDNAPSVADTLLTSESSRNAITSKTRSSGTMILSTYFSAALCTFYVKECGIFGNGATSAANSGTLFSHYLQAFDNRDGLNALTFEYSFVFS
jgi:hypothetical protein